MNNEDKYKKNNPTPAELLKKAEQETSVDRYFLGIDTPKSPNGLQSLNEGFDFLQHSNLKN